MSGFGSIAYSRPRMRDRKILFVVRYQSGPDAYMRVAPDIAIHGASPVVMRIAQECQVRGEIPPGKIASVHRVR
jgi:hypothetical protein